MARRRTRVKVSILRPQAAMPAGQSGMECTYNSAFTESLDNDILSCSVHERDWTAE